VLRNGHPECRHFPDQPPIFALALRPQTRPRCSLNSYCKGEVTENSPLLATHWCSTVPNHKTSCAQRSGQDCDWLKIKLFIFALSGLRLSRLTTHDSRRPDHTPNLGSWFGTKVLSHTCLNPDAPSGCSSPTCWRQRENFVRIPLKGLASS
jgi:hypothetical protein